MDRRNGNYSSCCRLCLNESQTSLRSIFAEPVLAQRIRDFVSVDVNHTDKLSTMICEPCTSKLGNWDRFKMQCAENQAKLAARLNSWTSPMYADMSINIKDESVDEREQEIIADDDEEVPIKAELIETEPVESHEDLDFPPPLTPHPLDGAGNSMNGDEDEDEMLVNSGRVRTDDSVNDADNSKECSICRKLFSTSGNRKKHEKMMHRGGSTKMLRSRNAAKKKLSEPLSMGTHFMSDTASNASSDIVIIHSPTPSPPPSSNPSPTPPVQPAEIQKIQFAAGLKLQRRSHATVEDTPMTQMESNYLEKSKLLFNMLDSLVCVCHNFQFESYKKIMGHIRKPGAWFNVPIFTCYNCMILFADRSSFMRHFFGCTKTPLGNLKRLTECTRTTDPKCRLYQNYRCLKCNSTFTFHEDFCAHLDIEHMEVDENANGKYKCLCGSEYELIDDYRNHICISCFLRYYCDICFRMFKDVDAFKEHCVAMHDNETGPLIKRRNHELNGGGVHNMSAPPIMAARRRESRKRPVSSPISRISKRQCIEVKSTSRVSLAVDSNDESNRADDMEPYVVGNLVVPPPEMGKRFHKTVCVLCNKTLSSFHNMIRHLRTHDEVKQQQGESAQLEEGGPPKFSCPDCKHLFHSLEEWTAHKETHPPKTCEECGKTFVFDAELDQHRSVHLNIKVYRDAKTQDYKSTIISNIPACRICNKSFNTKSELRQHALLHEKMPILSAHDAEDTDRKDVQQKIDKHTGKYMCLACDRTYLSKGGLWEHNKKYHGGKSVGHAYPRKCDRCERYFQTGASFTSHKKWHDKQGRDQDYQAGVAIDDAPPPTAPTKVINPVKMRRRKQMIADDEESYHSCNRCFKVFSTKGTLRAHMKSHGQSSTARKQKTYWCNVCHQACPGYSELQDHKEEHRNGGMPRLISEEDDNEKPLFFYCDICSKPFTTNFSLKQHRARHNLTTTTKKKCLVYCKYCRLSFENEHALGLHMEREHDETKAVVAMQTQQQQTNKDGRYACKICKKEFTNPVGLIAHRGWHKRSSYQKGVKIKSDVTEDEVPAPVARPLLGPPHAQSAPSAARRPGAHAPPPTKYHCHKCPKQFLNDTSLQIHVLETHRNVNATRIGLQCNSCKITFDAQAGYDKHMELHEVVVKQAEKQAERQAESRSKNTAVPTSTKAFPCKFCPAGFSRKDSLAHHVRQHHNHKCPHCEKSFEKLVSYHLHMRVHVREFGKTVKRKPKFSCSICHVGFDIPKELRDHVFAAHPF